MLVPVPSDYPPSSHTHVCISMRNRYDYVPDYTPEEYRLLHSVLAAISDTRPHLYHRAYITKYGHFHRLHVAVYDNPEYKAPVLSKLQIDYPPQELRTETDDTIAYLYTHVINMPLQSEQPQVLSLSYYYWKKPPQGTILDRSYLRWPITPQED